MSLLIFWYQMYTTLECKYSNHLIERNHEMFVRQCPGPFSASVTNCPGFTIFTVSEIMPGALPCSSHTLPWNSRHHYSTSICRKKSQTEVCHSFFLLFEQSKFE